LKRWEFGLYWDVRDEGLGIVSKEPAGALENTGRI
jgi:hypothetical protein